MTDRVHIHAITSEGSGELELHAYGTAEEAEAALDARTIADLSTHLWVHPSEPPSELLQAMVADSTVEYRVRELLEDYGIRHRVFALYLEPAPVARHREEVPSTPNSLRARHGIWGIHPEFPRSSWARAVDSGDTVLGYWEWVVEELSASRGTG